MKLRSFTAPDMQAAMKMVRDALGDEAVILATHSERKGEVRVTAALEREPFEPRREEARPRFGGSLQETMEQAHKRAQAQEWLASFSAVLDFHNTPPALIRRLNVLAQSLDLDAMMALQKLSASASGAVIEAKMTARILSHAFGFSALPLEREGIRLLLFGPPGIGKTLSIAKLATKMAMEAHPIAVFTTDTKRAGGVEQLAAFTDILGLPLHVADSPKSLASQLLKLPVGMSALIDTAGCNAYVESEMDEAATFASLPGIEPVLCMPAGIDAEESADMARAFAFSPVKRLIVTRLDAARRLGSVLAAADASGLAFSHSANTPKVTGELAALDAPLLAGLLLQHKRK